ncbi:Hypothetical predicted protein [Mytilus galloprovincialis]|uniref:Uncharacterized protein n=1 Tax=Mytilus galloprovincialis TaxID=29158 RepID=A0A8B6BHG3_MYTGA|nr:Hypothetical predicted protein [Mytilus galloprovincialis]
MHSQMPISALRGRSTSSTKNKRKWCRPSPWTGSYWRVMPPISGRHGCPTTAMGILSILPRWQWGCWRLGQGTPFGHCWRPPPAMHGHCIGCSNKITRGGIRGRGKSSTGEENHQPLKVEKQHPIPLRKEKDI